MSTKSITPTIRDEHGLVSIIITMIIMIVLTLIVLSFAQISRREQRSALDRQLSTQAFYAAESGINDARDVLQSWVKNNDARLNTDYMDDCAIFSAPANGNLPLGSPIGSNNNTSYTCLFVDPSPLSIVFTKSDTQHVFPLERKGGGALNTVEIYWDDGSGGSDFSGCPLINRNPQTWPANCDAPVLRVELVDNANLSANKVFFLYPHATTSTSLSFSSGTGAAAQGNCNSGGPNRCKVTINLPGSKYYLRLKSIYTPAAITIEANGGTAELKGAQALIDATGRAADVLRRIQVRVQANDLGGDIPLYALEGTDKICKQFSLLGGSSVTDNGACWGGSDPN